VASWTPAISMSRSVHGRTGLDVVALICALMDLIDNDRIDLLDLDRAGPVARQHALVPRRSAV
jgi:hypothetical protein